MKFSVLLPTRNRLDLLQYAVETVRRQNYENWEIIISDNDSEQNISGYVENLREERIKYYRTNKFISVTDNWNNAIEKASGDYIIMLGDDDCILKNFFSIISNLVSSFNHPDAIYTKSLLYAYPGAIPGYPNGFIRSYDYAPFFKLSDHPFILDRQTARDLVEDSMNFRMTYTYNMQHTILKHSFIDSLAGKGPFFQSPYPDFYATNVVFLMAERILISPIPLVVVGISTKSFGHFFFNKDEKGGSEFLNNLPDLSSFENLRQVLLPGSMDRTSWLFAMETIKQNFGIDHELRVNYQRYRFLQVASAYATYFSDRNKKQLMPLLDHLRFYEKIVYTPLAWAYHCMKVLTPLSLQKSLAHWFMKRIVRTPETEPPSGTNTYRNILDVFDNFPQQT